MKGLCLKVDGDGALFQIEGKQPAQGFYYNLEDLTSGTSAQNRAFHGLLTAFWYWMRKTDTWLIENGDSVIDLHSPNPDEFKKMFKVRYGAWFCALDYVTDDRKIVRIDNYYYKDGRKVRRTRDEMFGLVPKEVLDDFNSGNVERVKGTPKSWGDYTKKERRHAIDNLLWIVDLSGCDDRKVREIISWMTDSAQKAARVFGGEVIS